MVYNPRCSPANPAISTSRANLSRPDQAKEVLDEKKSDKVNEGRYSSVFNNCHVFVQRLKMRILNTSEGPDSSDGQRMSTVHSAQDVLLYALHIPAILIWLTKSSS